MKEISIVIVILIAGFLSSANSADPDPVRDFATGLSTFTLRNIFKNGDVSSDTGGIRAATDPQNFPGVRYVYMYIIFSSVSCRYGLQVTI